MAQPHFSRQLVRQKLAELLREPLERVANETRLRKLGRYETRVARELLKGFGLSLTEEQLRSLERVRDLLEAVESAPAVAREASAAVRQVAVDSPLVQLLTGTDQKAPVAERPAPPPAPSGTYVSAVAYEEARIHAAAVSCSDGRLATTRTSSCTRASPSRATTASRVRAVRWPWPDA